MSQHFTPTAPRMSYQLFGEGGPPVLFIMGFGMPGAVWGPQVDELKGDHRCCHYDNLGVGLSDRGPLLRTVPAMAEDAVRVLDTLSWNQAHIVGVSMG
ncbi:MAG: alpha/beta hydrolase, partial [Myxococcales bacterium]